MPAGAPQPVPTAKERAVRVARPDAQSQADSRDGDGRSEGGMRRQMVRQPASRCGDQQHDRYRRCRPGRRVAPQPCCVLRVLDQQCMQDSWVSRQAGQPRRGVGALTVAPCRVASYVHGRDSPKRSASGRPGPPPPTVGDLLAGRRSGRRQLKLRVRTSTPSAAAATSLAPRLKQQPLTPSTARPRLRVAGEGDQPWPVLGLTLSQIDREPVRQCRRQWESEVLPAAGMPAETLDQLREAWRCQ